jgi:hypothetical protein
VFSVGCAAHSLKLRTPRTKIATFVEDIVFVSSKPNSNSTLIVNKTHPFIPSLEGEKIMKLKWLTFTLLVLLLAACSQVEQAPSDETVEALASYPVYVLKENGVSPDQVKSLLASLGAEPQFAEPNPSVPINFIDTERFMAIPSTITGRGESKEGEGAVVLENFDFNALRRTKAVPLTTALETVQGAFKANGMFPSDVLPLSVVSATARFSKAEVVDAKGTLLFRANLDTHVMLGLKLNLATQIPLMGPGAKVKAVLNPEGRITQLYYGLYGMEEVRQVRIISRTNALTACGKAFAGVDGLVKLATVGAQLVYYVPDATGQLGRLEVAPSYLCTGSTLVGDSKAQLRKVLINAATGRPVYTGELAPGRDRASLSTQSIPRVDVGAEYIGVSQGLGGSQGNANGFVNTMTSKGIPVQFLWGDYAAWEQDFKDPSQGGDDSNWVDDVDMTFYTGHANGDGFTFPGNNDDGFLHYNDAVWGNRDLEWLVIAACGPLQLDSGGLRWWQRWGPAFQGLHQLLGYTNVSWDNTDEGRLMAEKVLGTKILWFTIGARTVRQAWVETATEVQPSSVTWAYMVPYGPNGSSNLNDYFWGRGTTTFDIPNPSGFIHVSGPS